MSSRPRSIVARLAPLVVAGVSLFGAGPLAAAPEPSPIPVRWQLDLEPGAVRVACVDVQGVGPRAFFYMTYLVTNNSGKDMYFAPSFELSTDEGELRRGGVGVPNEVVRAILEQQRNPLLKDQTDALGVLRQGKENAREGLVVWPAENLKVDRVTVYCVGFSGEIKRIPKPSASASESEGKDGAASGAASDAHKDQPGGDHPGEVALRKTLMLVHSTPGELTAQDNRPLTRVESRWIMR